MTVTTLGFVRVGENGQGIVLKLAINISLAVQMLAFAEGLLLAERAGIDRKRAVEVNEILTVARAAGYEHRDLAGLFEVLAQLTSGTTRPAT